MIIKDKIIEIFCIIDEFTKNLDAELQKNLKIGSSSDGKRHRNRKCRLSDSETMTILVCYGMLCILNFIKSFKCLFCQRRTSEFTIIFSLANVRINQKTLAHPLL